MKDDRPITTRGRWRYAPYYCEENVYWIAHGRSPSGHVVLVSNPNRTVALAAQRIGQGADRLVVWDYHVFFMDAGTVIDLDSVLLPGVSVADYRAAVFRPDLQRDGSPFAAIISIVPARAYVSTFSSDRSHMLASDGSYLQPPPPWSAIVRPGGGSTLFDLVDGDHPAVAYHGEDLDELLAL